MTFPNKPWQRSLLAVLLGLAATTAFAPFNLKAVALLAFAGLFWLARAATLRQSFALGWLFGFAHFASGMHWTYISTHVYGGAPAWLGLLLTGVLNAYLALYPALALMAVGWLRKRRPALALLAAPFAFTLGELLRGWMFTGFPWLSLGYVGLDTPLQRLAPVIGVHGLSLLLMALAAALAQLLESRGRNLVALAVPAAIAAAALLAPAPLSYTRDAGAPIATAIIQGQGEIRMNQKWQPAARELLLTRFRDMTIAAQGTPLVVWPEGPLPATYAALSPFYLAELDRILKGSGSALFVGVLSEQFEGQDPRAGLFNSTVLMGTGSGRYTKRHLVPFGEFFPIPDWLRPLMQVLGTPYSDFAFGPAEQPLLEAQGQKVFVNICFEDVFADEFRRHARGASLLINQTNDSWFGEAMAPWQHLQIARLRALENGRWFIRATNSGISAFIAPDGSVAVQNHKLYAVDLLRGSVTPRAGETPYARLGDAPLWWGSALLLLALFVVSRAGRDPPTTFAKP